MLVVCSMDFDKSEHMLAVSCIDSDKSEHNDFHSKPLMVLYAFFIILSLEKNA